MEKIELTLKNAKLKSYHRISWILAFINITIQLFFAFRPGNEQNRVLVIILSFVTLLFLVLVTRHQFTLLRKKGYSMMVCLLICGIWMILGLYWPVTLNTFFFVLYISSIRKFELLLLVDKIVYPSFPKREIQWSELQNILVKDGILTIDFKNDKLIQNEIEDNGGPNEKKINEFCREQLKK
jgi:hypothetical protein